METKPGALTCANCGHVNFLVVMRLDTVAEMKFDYSDELDENEIREKFGVNLL